MLALCSITGFGASNIQFLLTDPQFGISQTTNALITLQPVNIGNQGNIQVLPISNSGRTDSTGQYTFTNLNGGSIQGFYFWTIAIYNSSKRVTGSMWVSSTNLGTVSESFIDNVNGAPTYPAGTWAWSMIASDLRYQQNGTNALNQFYPLFGNPSNYVQNATLLAASNAIVSMTPNTNGFATTNYVGVNYYPLSNPSNYVSSNSIPAFLGSYLTNNQTGNVNIGTNATLGTSNLVVNGAISAPSGTIVTLTANSLGPISGTLSINTSGGTVTAGANTMNPSGFTTAGGSLAPSGFIGNGGQLTNLNAGSITGLLQSVNIPSFIVTNGALLTASNFLATNGLGLLIQTNNQLVNLSSNLFNINSNAIVALSGSLSGNKQPASAILTNLSVTGANTNIYLAGIGSYLTTNISGNIQSINVSNQVQLTNGITGTAYAPVGSLMSTNLLPSLTNQFLTSASLGAYATTNYVNQATNGFTDKSITNNLLTQSGASAIYYPTSNPSGFVSLIQLVSSNFVNNATLLLASNGLVALIPSTNGLASTNQINAATNFANQLYGLGTNFANTNALALFNQATNFSNTNTSSFYVASTNGTATGLNVQSFLKIGTKTNWLTTTNAIGLVGGGSPFVAGTYEGVQFGNVLTNFYYPFMTILKSGGTYSVQSNSTTLYASSDGINWITVSGIAPPPVGSFGIYDNNDGKMLKGWIDATNLVSQMRLVSTLGGYFSGPATNGAFSATGSNTIINLVAQYASTNSGATLTEVTNLINALAVTTNGATANGQTVYLTNGPNGYYWAAAPSGSSTNGLSSIQFVTNLTFVTSNALQSQISAGGIGTQNGLGTNTTLVTAKSIDVTNLFLENDVNGNGHNLTNFWAVIAPNANGFGMYMLPNIGGTNSFYVGNGSPFDEFYTVVLGGSNNDIGQLNFGGAIVGGIKNGIGNTFLDGSGTAAFIAGGASNNINGNFSFAAGVLNTNAPNQHNVFMWNDGSSGRFSSVSANTFLVNSSGGVGINTNNPSGYTVNIYGNLNATNLLINGNPVGSGGTIQGSFFNQLYVTNSGVTGILTNYDGIYTKFNNFALGNAAVYSNSIGYWILGPGNYTIGSIGFGVPDGGFNTVTNLSSANLDSEYITASSTLLGNYGPRGVNVGTLLVSGYEPIISSLPGQVTNAAISLTDGFQITASGNYLITNGATVSIFATNGQQINVWGNGIISSNYLAMGTRENIQCFKYCPNSGITAWNWSSNEWMSVTCNIVCDFADFRSAYTVASVVANNNGIWTGTTNQSDNFLISCSKTLFYWQLETPRFPAGITNGYQKFTVPYIDWNCDTFDINNVGSLGLSPTINMTDGSVLRASHLYYGDGTFNAGLNFEVFQGLLTGTTFFTLDIGDTDRAAQDDGSDIGTILFENISGNNAELNVSSATNGIILPRYTFDNAQSPAGADQGDLTANIPRIIGSWQDGALGIPQSTVSTNFPLNASLLSIGTAPTARLGSGTANSSSFLRGDSTWSSNGSGLTNLVSTIQTYSTNATLSVATSLQIFFSPGFADTNYVISSPNAVALPLLTARGTNNFTISFSAATVTTTIEGVVMHR